MDEVDGMGVYAIVGYSNPAMTRLYTHTSEAAAGTAVASLPDITGQITCYVRKRSTYF